MDQRVAWPVLRLFGKSGMIICKSLDRHAAEDLLDHSQRSLQRTAVLHDHAPRRQPHTGKGVTIAQQARHFRG